MQTLSLSIITQQKHLNICVLSLLSAHSGSSRSPPSEMCEIYSLSCYSSCSLFESSSASLSPCFHCASVFFLPLISSLLQTSVWQTTQGSTSESLFLNRWLIKQHVCIGKLSIFSVLFVFMCPLFSQWKRGCGFSLRYAKAVFSALLPHCREENCKTFSPLITAVFQSVWEHCADGTPLVASKITPQQVL